MLLLGWLLYGLLASAVFALVTPYQESVNEITVIFLAVFLVLGGIDYMSSTFAKHSRRSIKFGW